MPWPLSCQGHWRTVFAAFLDDGDAHGMPTPPRYHDTLKSMALPTGSPNVSHACTHAPQTHLTRRVDHFALDSNWTETKDQTAA